MDGAASASVWADLAPIWQLAFQEAWTSWSTGNFGIGAVLVDPATESVVATGRNRVGQRERTIGTISGNFMAHAEMNAFAAMPTMFARGFHLYTTLEPCLMCAAAAIQLNVEHVHFAANDEFFEGLDDLWTGHPYTAERRPERTGPMVGPLASFARALPMSFMLLRMPDGRAADHAREATPALAALAADLAHDAQLAELANDDAPVSAALDHVWPRLHSID